MPVIPSNDDWDDIQKQLGSVSGYDRPPGELPDTLYSAHHTHVTVKVTAAKDHDVNGYYSGIYTFRNSEMTLANGADGWQENLDDCLLCLVYGPNDEVLTVGQRYPGKIVGQSSGGWPLVEITGWSPGGGISGVIGCQRVIDSFTASCVNGSVVITPTYKYIRAPGLTSNNTPC